MSFSITLVRRREEEAEKLRKFITYSLLGSLALHIGVLTFGISHFFKNKTPDISSKPIEVTIIEPLSANGKNTPEFKVAKSDGEAKSGGGGGGGKLSISLLGKSNNILSNNSINRKLSNSSQSIIQQPIPLQIQPIKPKLNSLNTAPTFRQIQRQVERKVEKLPQEIDTKSTESPVIPQPISKTDISTKVEPTIQASVNPVVNPLVAPTEIPTTQGDTTSTSDNLAKSPSDFSRDRMRKLIADGRNGITGTRDTLNSGNNSDINNSVNNGNGTGVGTGNGTGVATGNGTGVGTGNGTGVGTGNGTGVGTGNGTGNGTGVGTGNSAKPKPTEEKKVAIAPIPKLPSSSKLDRADCQECNIKYPESARKRRIEGNPEVTLDYDNNGRVRNVRLNRSSGSQELDEALLEQARNFKLKPSEGGKQGVRVSANFAIQGSQRHRDVITRKRKREERKREEQSQQQPQKRESMITDVPPEVGNPRNTEEIPKRRTNVDTNETESNRRLESNSTEKPRKNRRKKPANTEQSNQSQESNNGTRKKKLARLRDVLRSRKQPELSSPNVPVVEPQADSTPASQTESSGESGNGN